MLGTSEETAVFPVKSFPNLGTELYAGVSEGNDDCAKRKRIECGIAIMCRA